jgi:hypothetical protein
MTLWYTFCSFGNIFFGFWYREPRKIWQPWFCLHDSKVLAGAELMKTSFRLYVQKQIFAQKKDLRKMRSLKFSTELKMKVLPDFSRYDIPKRGEMYQKTTKLPKGRIIYRMAIIYSKWPLNMLKFSISRPSKIYPNLDFWV